MSILTTIKRNLDIRFQYLIRNRAQKKYTEAIIKKYNLNDSSERQKIIEQFVLMQKNKRVFGRKYGEEIRDKISFMIHHGLIKVVE